MREVKQKQEEERPLSVVKKATVYLVLGRVDAPGVAIEDEGAGNSTRWVFDLESQGGEEIEIRLLDYRSGRKLHPDLMSWCFSALDPSFYDAKPVGSYDTDSGVFTISTSPLDRTFSCRVAIDVMHTSTR